MLLGLLRRVPVNITIAAVSFVIGYLAQHHNFHILNPAFINYVDKWTEPDDYIHPETNENDDDDDNDKNGGNDDDVFWSQVQEDRLRLMEDTCRDINRLGRQYWRGTQYLDTYLKSPGGEIAYCLIPKAACTWWMVAFAHMFGVKEEEIILMEKLNSVQYEMLQRHVTAGSLHHHGQSTTSSSSSSSSSSFNFIFVRHPISRLISTYIDKFEVGDMSIKASLLVEYGLRGDELTFPTFVDVVIHEARVDKTTWGTMHWMPYYNLCSICGDARLHMIGHLETMASDLSYMIFKFPFLKNYLNASKKKNVVSSKNKRNQSEKYLSQLSQEQKSLLCDIYKWDLVMFNYTCYL